MDDDSALFALLGLGIFALIALWLVGLIPVLFVIQGNWNGFPWWFTANIWLSRILLGFLIFPLYMLVTLTGKLSYFTKGINAAILAIWGLPLYKKTVLNMAFTELSGLDLQRSVLIIVSIITMELSIYLGGSNNNDD